MRSVGTQFTLTEHHQFVRSHGEQLDYYVAMPCSCGGGDPSRARQSCTLCGGRGYRYKPPVRLTGIVTSIHREKSLMEAGLVQPGDAVLGLSPFDRHMLSDWDMVELPFWSRGQSVWGGAIQRSVDSADDLLPHTVKDLQYCESQDPDTDEITSYTRGTDFTITGNVLTWLDGQPQPAPESYYSIRYTALLQWIIFLPPQDRYDGGVSIGQKAILRLRHIAFSHHA